MKKLLYYLILCALFAIILFLCSTIVSLIFSDPGTLIMYLMCAVVLSIFGIIKPIIKKKMNM